MKYLFYIISDLNPITLVCADILYKSLKIDNYIRVEMIQENI